MTERLLLRVEEVAELLNLGRSKTYALIAAGELPSIRLGRSVRVPAAALRQWLEAQGPVLASEESPEHEPPDAA